MALLETSLLQQPQSRKLEGRAPSAKSSVAEQTAVLAHPAAAPTSGASATKDMPQLLSELVRVATEISRTDQMIKNAAASAPLESEAQKWHEVSLRALGWSRDALAEQQDNILTQMKRILQPSATVAPAACEPSTNEPVVKEPAGFEHVGSLRGDLEKLRSYEPACCILVRKLKQLGVGSPDKLRGYFSRFGGVMDVLVAHSLEKPCAKRPNGRVRPASLGFVVMESAALAQTILAGGEVRTMDLEDGHYEIVLQRYEPSAAIGTGEVNLHGGESGGAAATVQQSSSSSEPEPESMFNHA